MKYKFHRNLVNKLNIKTKKEFYKKLTPNDTDTVKKFWKTFKPLFSEKEVPGFDKLILVENETIISNKNSYFSHITDTLDIKKWPMPNDINPTDDNVTIAILKNMKVIPV